MDVTQRRLLNELNFSNNTLDPIIALTLIAVLDTLLLLVGAWTAQKVFTMETSQK